MGVIIIRAYDLNPEKLGKSFIGLIPASVAANHSYPSGTARDYIDHSEPEAEFMSDLLNLSTKELVDKWYDGDEAVRDLIFKLKNG